VGKLGIPHHYTVDDDQYYVYGEFGMIEVEIRCIIVILVLYLSIEGLSVD
jgi:hypothetical protein